ncbi:MAG: SDR family oxidoreductase [Rhizobiaceae bacterium]
MKALITGAAHGLGRALTEELLHQGHDVVAVDRDTEPLNALSIINAGACTVYNADLQNVGSVTRLLTNLRTHEFDLVILNAGISATGKFEDIPVVAYDRLIAVNLFAPIHLASRLVGDGLMTQKSKIVFISSLSHAVGYPGGAVYAATKDAIAAYARSVAKPFKKRRVGVLTVFPGPINTEHAKKHAPDNSDTSKRMEPQKLAKMILKAAKGRSRIYYPGSRAYFAGMFGRMFPTLATRMMRKGLYEKMKDPIH